MRNSNIEPVPNLDQAMFARDCFTPKGLHNTAQGCREAATLGSRATRALNPERVEQKGLVQIMQPLQGWGFWTRSQPRAALRLPWAMIFNPFGVKTSQHFGSQANFRAIEHGTPNDEGKASLLLRVSDSLFDVQYLLFLLCALCVFVVKFFLD
jgi:hypothetical protein